MMHVGRAEPLLAILVLFARAFMPRVQAVVPFQLNPSHVNKRMFPDMLYVTLEGVTSLAGCAMRCLRIPYDCRSVSYRAGTRTCELSYWTSEHLLIPEEGWIYTNIALWPKEMVRGCSECDSLTRRCIPADPSAMCLSNHVFPDECLKPQNLNNATIKIQPWYIVPGTTVEYECDDGMSEVRGTSDMTITCYSGGVWSKPKFVCL